MHYTGGCSLKRLGVCWPGGWMFLRKICGAINIVDVPEDCNQQGCMFMKVWGTLYRAGVLGGMVHYIE